MVEGAIGRAAREKWVAKSLAEVGEFFGVSRRTAADWAARGMPGSAQKYPLSKIAQWLRANIAPAPGVGKPSDNEDLDRAEQELDIERKRLRLRKEAGELVSRGAAIAQIEQLFSTVRARLEALPDEVGTSIPADFRTDAVSDWKSKIILVCRELEEFAIEDADRD